MNHYIYKLVLNLLDTNQSIKIIACFGFLHEIVNDEPLIDSMIVHMQFSLLQSSYINHFNILM